MWFARRSQPGPTVLLTLGRLPKALELARALRTAGCRVVVAEPFRWHVCKPSRAVAASYQVTPPNTDRRAYLRELLEIINREGVELVVPVSEEALHVAALQESLPRGVRLLCPGFGALAHMHDKLAFARYATSRGLAVPDTHREQDSAAEALMAAGDYVAKPAHSCSGIGVSLCRNGARHTPGAPGMLVQRLVEGDHISSLSLLHEGRELVTVLYRGAVYAGTVAICFERVDVAASVHSWIRKFCQDINYSGFIAFDFIVDAQGEAWAIECNPRPTSGVHFLDSAALGQAMLAPDSVDTIPLKPVRRMQWAYSTLTEAYAAILRPAECGRRFKRLFTSRDVVWSLRDPLPFLLMTPMSWEILWPALTTDLSLGEATQRDIAWLSGGTEPSA